jgi:hypothetical protein
MGSDEEPECSMVSDIVSERGWDCWSREQGCVSLFGLFFSQSGILQG